MKTRIFRVRAHSSITGRRLKSYCWKWKIMRPDNVPVLSGYARTLRDARNDVAVLTKAMGDT